MAIKYSKQQWQQMQPLLDEVLMLPEEQRMPFLQQKCSDDPQMLLAISDILSTETPADSLFEFSPKIQLAGHSLDQISADNVLSGYRLTSILGHGGMGVVYLGERVKGDFDRQVAIKLLHSFDPDSDKRQKQLARFKLEQQTLASLVHPQIAQLYDTGFSSEKRPYFVMELVSGENLFEYCRKHKLQLEQKVELIIQVANVLGFAHQNLVVHRDIKGSNILVTKEGEIKLLDFGIAKLIDPNFVSDVTKTGESLLTLGAAAPEQIKNQSITVATDIFQLGLVLYELLTEKKAFSDKANSLFGLARAVCEQIPTLPSKILDKAAPNYLSLEKKLKGELDAIVLKALGNQPSERYGTIQEFAADLRAYLHNERVLAYQSSGTYLLKKQIRRHWRPLLLATSFTGMVLAYAVTITIHSEQIQQALLSTQLEARKAQQVSDFIIDIFKQSDPNVSGLEKTTAKQLLERAQLNIRNNLYQVPLIRTHMLTVLGDIYYSQSQYQQSTDLLKEALKQQLKQAPEPDKSQMISRANIQTKLAISLSTLDEYDEAMVLLDDSIKLYQQASANSISSNFKVNYAEALNAYGNLLRLKGQSTKAENQYLLALQFIDTSLAGKNERAVALNGLAFIYHFQGRFELAVANMREATLITKTIYGEKHSYYTMALNNLVTILTDLEYFNEATILSEQALSIQQQLFGSEHHYVAKTLRGLGLLAHRQGDFVAAKQYLVDALDTQRLNQTEDDINVAVIQLWLGTVLQDIGEFNEASEQYQSMLSTFEKHGVDNRLLGRGLCQPASLALAQGQLNQSLELYGKALLLLPESGLRTSMAQLGWAKTAYLLKQDRQKAELMAREALRVRVANFPAGHSLIAQAQGVLGLILADTAPKEAKVLLVAANLVLAQRLQFTKRKDQYNLVNLVQRELNHLSQMRVSAIYNSTKADFLYQADHT